MHYAIESTLYQLKRESKLHLYSESTIRQCAVVRLLHALHWNVYDPDEVVFEPHLSRISSRAKAVDVALKAEERWAVFINVRKSALSHREEEEFLNQCSRSGARIGILTDGVLWRFFLPLLPFDFPPLKEFLSLSLRKDDISKLTDQFLRFLSKENVVSGRSFAEAERKWEEERRNVEKETAVLEEMWDRIRKTPPQSLTELLTRLCQQHFSYTPNENSLKAFVSTLAPTVKLSIHRYSQLTDSSDSSLSQRDKRFKRESRVKTKYLLNGEDYTGKKIVGFYFQNTHHPVDSWKKMLLKVCHMMYASHPEKFDKVLSLRGAKRLYFSRVPQDLRAPMPISNSGIHVETHFSANSVVALSRKVIELFGYPITSLIPETV